MTSMEKQNTKIPTEDEWLDVVDRRESPASLFVREIALCCCCLFSFFVVCSWEKAEFRNNDRQRKEGRKGKLTRLHLQQENHILVACLSLFHGENDEDDVISPRMTYAIMISLARGQHTPPVQQNWMISDVRYHFMLHCSVKLHRMEND